jgi:hypothetical protein
MYEPPIIRAASMLPNLTAGYMAGPFALLDRFRFGSISAINSLVQIRNQAFNELFFVRLGPGRQFCWNSRLARADFLLTGIVRET